MARSLALLALTGAVVAAQTTTVVDLFVPMADDQKMLASVVDVGDDATTYALQCPKGGNCGVTKGQILIQGPSTVSMAITYNEYDGTAVYTENIACNIEPKLDEVTCTVSESASDSATVEQTSTVVSTTGFSSYLQPVTVTAGAEKLSAAPGSTVTESAPSTALSTAVSTTLTTATGATATGSSNSSASASGSGSGSGSSAATASGSGTAASSASASATGNAAVAMVTKNAILAGAAAILGGAMML